MRRRRHVLGAIAIVFALVDLTHKLLVRAQYHHVRSAYVALAMAAVICGLILFVPRIPSRVARVGGSVAVGGALGNLLSLAVWRTHGVPDPIVVAGATRGVAFNLADVFAISGDAVMISALIVHVMRNRALLRTSV